MVRSTNTRQKNLAIHWTRAFSLSKLLITLVHAANADGGAQPNNLIKAPARFVVTGCRYVNPTGLAAHAANFAVITVKQGATVVATWSTETGQGGTLTANTYVNMTLSATAADLVVEADETLTLNADESGTTTLPAGRVEVFGYWVDADVDYIIHKAAKRVRLLGAAIKLKNGVAASDTNYYTILLKNGATVIGTFDTRAANQGALAADTFGAFSMHATIANRVLAADDKITLSLDETGDVVLSDLELDIDGIYL